MKCKKISLLLITLFCSLGLRVNAQSFENKRIINIPGQYEVAMRTRYQGIKDDLLGDANAFTTRINVTASYDLTDAWQFSFQPNYVYAFNEGDYNSVTVKKYTSPIPDPPGFNLSKIFLTYASEYDWQVNIGRQALSFNNERMVGAIEYWQTPQNFDAIKFDFNNQINWHLQYAYSNKVHRIFGQDSTENLPKDDVRFGLINKRPVNEWGQHKVAAHLINLDYKTENNLSVTSYAYLLENKDQAKFSTNTFGARISDEFKPAKFKYRYLTEFAFQQDAYNNPYSYQAWYSLLEASVQYKSHTIKMSQEILSANNMQGFITPLGTNHKFQGWADVFTVYGMQTGLRDQYLTYRGRHKKLRWRAVFHHFKSYQNSAVIGNELDVELAYRATRMWEFKFVYANYQTKEGIKYFPKANNDLATWFISLAYNI